MASFPESYVNSVIRADAFRRQWKPGVASPDQKNSHSLWELPFNVIGSLFGMGVRFLPPATRQTFDLWVIRKMAGRPELQDPLVPAHEQRVFELSDWLQQKTGQYPAVLFPTSHADTEGPYAWLRFEVFYRAIHASFQLLRRFPTPFNQPIPQCVLAVDPYAVDSVSLPIGAIYAAWMSQVYFTIHRQPSQRLWFHRYFFFSKNAASQVGWRFLRSLKKGVPLTFALGGGLPHNARLFYTVREFIKQLPFKSWPMHPVELQKQLCEILTRPVGTVWPPEEGELPRETQQAVIEFLRSLGFSPTAATQQLEDLQDEFARPVPYRRRLWKILLRKVARTGKPLLVQALQHVPDRPVCWSQPCGVYFQDGRYFVCFEKGHVREVASIDSFGKELVSSIFR